MKHKYTVEELKELLYEAELDERVERAKDWERIKRHSDKAFEKANIPKTPLPARHVRKALAYDEYEGPTYDWTDYLGFVGVFMPMFICMFILYVAGDM